MINFLDHPQTENRLLNYLPLESYQRLAPHLQRVSLRAGEMLYEAGEPLPYVWFIVSGIVGLLAMTLEGESVEIGLIGFQGMVGLTTLLRKKFLPCQVTCLLDGEALRLPSEILYQEFNDHPETRDLLSRYAYLQSIQIIQASVCNHFHTIEQRLSRFLLFLNDHHPGKTLHLTQQLIADALGAQRTGISLTAGRLQKQGLIHCERERITILNRQSLETRACECYGTLHEEWQRLFEK